VYLDVGTALQEEWFTVSKATIPQVFQFILHLLHFSLLIPAEEHRENYFCGILLRSQIELH